MESIGAMADGEWCSFNEAYSSEEADFMAQLLGNCSLPNEVQSSSNLELSTVFWPNHHESEGPMYSSDDTNADMYSFSQGRSYSSGGSTSLFPISSLHQFHPSEYPHPVLMRNDSLVSISYYNMADSKNTTSDPDQIYTDINLMEAGDEFLNQYVSNDSMESAGNLPEGKSMQFRRDHEMQLTETSLEDKEDILSETSKKRPRVPIDVKNKRIVKPKRNEKLNSIDNNDESDKHIQILHRQHSSNCLSEDDSNASHEFNGGAASNSEGAITALNSNGKTRASRGSATDPQSLYARKRRERINERLRILQNLVPNGTKVDISTMLEEAVQYVKFLQLQIKLLSSDDLWMYAPIAYNGMDIGLDLKIGTPKS